MLDSSRRLFPAVATAIEERAPCDVNIIGHADRMGSREYNIALSLKRARVVAGILRQMDLPLEQVTVESYGEEDPVIPTADGVAEPKNRRVEILVR